VPNHNELTYLLTAAAEIDHELMCCCLFAAQSLRRDLSDEIIFIGGADRDSRLASGRPFSRRPGQIGAWRREALRALDDRFAGATSSSDVHPASRAVGGIEGARLLESMCILWTLYGVRTNTWKHAFKLLRR